MASSSLICASLSKRFASRTFGAVRHLSSKAKGSFLLQTPDEISEAARVAKKDVSLNEKVGRELIALRDKQMGPNVSVFYKQVSGSLLIVYNNDIYLSC